MRPADRHVRHRSLAPAARAAAFAAQVAAVGDDRAGRRRLARAVGACGTTSLVVWACRPVASPGALAPSPLHSAIRSLVAVSAGAQALARDSVPDRAARVLRPRRFRRDERRRVDLRAGEALSVHQRSLTLLGPSNDALASRAASIAASARMALDSLADDLAVLDGLEAAMDRAGAPPAARGLLGPAARVRRDQLGSVRAVLAGVERDAAALAVAARAAASSSSSAARTIRDAWGGLLARVASTPTGGDRPEAAALAAALSGGVVPAPTGAAAIPSADRLAERLSDVEAPFL